MTFTLYRLFDADGAPLYIGSSCDPAGRMAHHRHRPWWQDVASITFEKYEDELAARRAEVDAIASERPRFNVNHGPAPRRMDGDHWRRKSVTMLERLRVERFLTPEELGEQTGVTGRTIRRLEAGQPRARLSTIARLSTYFGLSARDLLATVDPDSEPIPEQAA